MSVIGSGKRNGFPSKPLRDSSPKRSRPLLVPSRFSPLALLNPHGDQRETAINQKPPKFHRPISTKHLFPSKLVVRWVGKAKFHLLCCPAGQQPHKTTEINDRGSQSSTSHWLYCQRPNKNSNRVYMDSTKLNLVLD